MAAIANKNTIIGASDRMLTAGDIEFEPGQSKLWYLTSSIYCMLAGDSALQMEIMKRVTLHVKTKPSLVWSVREVAQLYAAYHQQLVREHAELIFLHPLGLTSETFLDKQASMDASTVEKLVHQLQTYTFDPPLAVIVAVVDQNGPLSKDARPISYLHLYVVNASKVACFDGVGFASIGIGAGHANSQFMVSGHWAGKSLAETLLVTYAAKKRAEVAPGVGEATDMFTISTSIGSASRIDETFVDFLDFSYNEQQSLIAQSHIDAQQKIAAYLENANRDKIAAGQMQEGGTVSHDTHPKSD